MAIGTVAPAPPLGTRAPRIETPASARLDRLAAGFLGLGGVVTLLVVAAAVTLP